MNNKRYKFVHIDKYRVVKTEKNNDSYVNFFEFQYYNVEQL